MGFDEQKNESVQENFENIEQEEINEKQNDNSVIDYNPEIYNSSETLDYFNSLSKFVPNDYQPPDNQIMSRAGYASFKSIYNALRADFTQAESAVYNMISSTNAGLRSAIAELSATTFREMNWAEIRVDAIGSVLAEYNIKINAVSRTANDNYTYIKNQRTDITALQNNATSLSKSISDNFTYIKAQRVDITALQNNLSALTSSVSNNYLYITNLRADLNKVSTSLASTDVNVNNNLTYIQGLRTDLTTANNNATNTNKNVANNLTYIQGLRIDLTTTNNNATNTNKNVANNLTYIQGLRTDLTTTNNNLVNTNVNVANNLTYINTLRTDLITTNNNLVNTNKNVANNLSYINALRTDLTMAVLDYKASDNDLSKRIDTVDTRIDNLDKALIASLALVNTKLDTNNDKLGLIYDRLQAYFDRDGIFTIAIREQFTRLITAQESSFWTDGKVEENVKDGSFVKLLKALIYSMRYGLIAEFSDFTKIFKEEMKSNRDNFNNYISVVNQNLVTTVGWLKLIYEKKTIVEIPPISVLPSNPFVFNYDRLQKMFDGLNIGESVGSSVGDVINEAADNLWTFLGKLVEQIPEIIDSLGDVFLKLAHLIIDFLIPKDTSVITDFFKNFNDKIDVKFEGFNQIGDLLSNSFSVSESDFKDVTFDFNGKKEVIISKEIPNQFAPTIKLILSALVWVLTLMMCHKRISTEVVK